jgi:hypothetical protein
MLISTVANPPPWTLSWRPRGEVGGDEEIDCYEGRVRQRRDGDWYRAVARVSGEQPAERREPVSPGACNSLGRRTRKRRDGVGYSPPVALDRTARRDADHVDAVISGNCRSRGMARK